MHVINLPGAREGGIRRVRGNNTHQPHRSWNVLFPPAHLENFSAQEGLASRVGNSQAKIKCCHDPTEHTLKVGHKRTTLFLQNLTDSHNKGLEYLCIFKSTQTQDKNSQFTMFSNKKVTKLIKQ